MATATDKNRYIEGVGRRKTAVARVRITPSAKPSAQINDTKTVEEYFATKTLQDTALAALKTSEVPEKFSITVHVKGGGTNAQAEAMRHGLSRALEKFNPALRAPLKKAGFLKRDPRAVERKHFGLKKARRAPQWSKR